MGWICWQSFGSLWPVSIASENLPSERRCCTRTEGLKRRTWKTVPQVSLDQGCGIKGFLPTSVIQGNPPLYEETSLGEALSVVSQKWSFPTALPLTFQTGHSDKARLAERAQASLNGSMSNFGLAFWAGLGEGAKHHMYYSTYTYICICWASVEGGSELGAFRHRS